MGKLARLLTMTPHEIGYRVRERVRQETERVRQPDRAKGEWAGCLRDAFDSRFYFSAADRPALQEFVATRFPQWQAKAISEADSLLGSRIDWHKDPVSGTCWPLRFWADYDPVHDTSCGDAKVIHELNRTQHLPRLGKAFFLSGNERYAADAISQIDGWIAQNPVGMGINWQSSLEISIRVLSWLWTIAFLLPSKAFTEEFASRVANSLVAQLRHVYRYPSVYSSPNTHLIGEAAVLFIAGSLFAGLDEANKWREFGAEFLTREIDRQVLSDGVHSEVSTYYHCYAADFYLQALMIVRRNQVEFPPVAWRKVEQMLDFVMRISKPDGCIPLLGDDDGGRALALDQPTYRSYLDGLCIGAVVFNRPDFKSRSSAFQEEALWLLGAQAGSDYEALGTAVPSSDGNSFPAAGYFVQRSGWGAADSHMVFDCGGLGLPSGGHGHADALSLVLSVGGREMLVDPGTCVYNAATEWRSFFRSSRAHNTVVVDGQDQSKAGGTFQWCTQAETQVRNRFELEELAYVEGEHRGYARLSSPVSHKRRLLHCKGYWIVVDELEGSGKHTFDFLYHFSPELALDLQGSPDEPVEVLAHAHDSALLLFLDATASLRPKIICGQDAPLQGWVSSGYGVKQPAPVLCATAECSVPLRAVTIIAPFRLDHAPVVRRETVAGCALSCSITHGRHTDLLMLPEPDATIEVAGLHRQGEMFWLRTSAGAPQQLLGVGVRRQGQPAAYQLTHFFEDRIEVRDGTDKDKTYVRDLRDCEVRCV